MTLTFTQTSADLQDFATHRLKRSPLIKGIVILSGIMAVVYAFSFFSREGVSTESVLSLLLPLALVALIWVVVFKRLLKKQLQNTDNKNSIAEQLTFELSEKEVHIWTSASDTRHQWAAFTKLEQSNKSYFLYLGKIKAIVIPKRAFESEAEQAEFLAIINEQLKMNN